MPFHLSGGFLFRQAHLYNLELYARQTDISWSERITRRCVNYHNLDESTYLVVCSYLAVQNGLYVFAELWDTIN